MNYRRKVAVHSCITIFYGSNASKIGYDFINPLTVLFHRFWESIILSFEGLNNFSSVISSIGLLRKNRKVEFRVQEHNPCLLRLCELIKAPYVCGTLSNFISVTTEEFTHEDSVGGGKVDIYPQQK